MLPEAPPRRHTATSLAVALLPSLLAATGAGTALALEKPEVAPAERQSSDEALRVGRAEVQRLADERWLVSLQIGFDLGGRRFGYSDGLSPNLPAYAVFGAPMASGRLEVYPLAATGIPFLRDLGLRGWVSRAVGLDSATMAGTKIATEWSRFGGDVHARFLVPRAHKLRLGVGVGVDDSWFDMNSYASLSPLLPGTRVTSLRFALDARVYLGARLSLFADGAFLLPLAFTDVYQRFRTPTVYGVDVGGGLAVALVRGLEVQVRARYTRFFSSFKPVPGDAYVAGGALDEQVQLGVGLVYAH